MNLPILHITQQGNGWSNDCGPATVLMLLRSLELARDVSVRWIAERIDAAQDGTDSAALVRGFRLFGVDAQIGADVYPRIEIVDYGQLLRLYKAPNYKDSTFLHWIVRESPGVYLDALHTVASAGRVACDPSIIDAAHASGIARAKRAGYDCRHVSVIEKNNGGPIVAQTSGKAVIRWQSWNVRADTSSKFGAASGSILGQLENGQEFIITREISANGLTFGEIDLRAGGAELRASGKVKTPRTAYVLKQGNGWQYVDSTPKPPNTPPTPAPAGVIGVHPALPVLPFHLLLGVHMLELGKPELDVYLDAGCRSFTCMNNVNAAREARAAGSAVIFRRFMDHGAVVDARSLVKYMGLERSDRLMVMGTNEADNLSTSDLRTRFAWDKAFCEAVWDLLPNCFPLLGSFSMGTPQLENPDKAREWRETYGAWLNANWHRCGINYHSYSARPRADLPPSNATVIAEEWLGTRFIKWAYHPEYGALDRRVLLTGDESGVDIGGIGGFRDSQYTEADLERWWNMRAADFSPHAQQYAFNLFQGNAKSARWAGYNVLPYLGVLRRIWRGELNGSVRLREVGAPAWREALPAGAADSPLSPGWNPPAKNHK